MPFTQKYFKEYNFLLTTVKGVIDAQQLAEHIMSHNRRFKDIQGLRELADCTGITNISNITTQAVIDAAAYLQTDKPGGILALLTAKDNVAVYGLANAYRMFAEDHQDEIRLFTDFHTALSWLVADASERAQLIQLIDKP